MKKSIIGIAVLVTVIAAAWLIQNPEPISIGRDPGGVMICAWTQVGSTTAWLSESELGKSPWKNRKIVTVTAETWEQAESWLKMAKSHKKAWVQDLYHYDYSYPSYEYSYVYDEPPNKK